MFPLLHAQALDCRLSVIWVHGDKLTAYLAYELREQQVAVISLYPGVVRTEAVMRSR